MNIKSVKANFEYQNLTISYIKKTVLNPVGTILFLPGFSSDFAVFQSVINEIDNFDYFGISYPGHGTSVANSENDYDFFLYTEIIIHFITKIIQKPVYIVGHSMGGGIAMVVSAKIETQISGAFLIAPVNKTIQNLNLAPLFFPTSLSDWKQVAKNFYHNFADRIKSELYMNQIQNWIHIINTNGQESKGFKKLGFSLITDEVVDAIELGIKGFKKPIWMVYGDSDKIIDTQNISNYYYSINPKVVCVQIQNCGHTPWMDQFMVFSEILKSFLNKFKLNHEIT